MSDLWPRALGHADRLSRQNLHASIFTLLLNHSKSKCEEKKVKEKRKEVWLNSFSTEPSGHLIALKSLNRAGKKVLDHYRKKFARREKFLEELAQVAGENNKGDLEKSIKEIGKRERKSGGTKKRKRKKKRRKKYNFGIQIYWCWVNFVDVASTLEISI